MWNGLVACVLSDQKINILKKLTLPLGLYVAVSSLVLSLQALCVGPAKPKKQVKLKFMSIQLIAGFL